VFLVPTGPRCTRYFPRSEPCSVQAWLSNREFNSARLGAAIGALIGGLYGAEACFVVAASGFVLQAAVILLSPVARLERQPEMTC
jgi:hypothetical protein